MLVMKEQIGGGSSNGPIAIGETVVVKGTNQTGTVVGYTSGLWEVKTTEGNTINVAESKLEIRQVLFG